MASPVITNITVSPASPVVGQPFTIKVDALDPDTRTEAYDITVRDQMGASVSQQVQVPFHDPVFVDCVPVGNAPAVARDTNDATLFRGVAA